jgi:FkbM family methyltransferase
MERPNGMQLKSREFLKGIFGRFGVGVTSSRNLQRLNELAKDAFDYSLVNALPRRHASTILDLLPFSKSQLHQDLFVLATLDFKREGFFVEFGATNGLDLSNTYLMEKNFGWQGILAEPARTWQQSLRQNRTAVVESDCVWEKTGERLRFSEVNDPELSSLQCVADSDRHKGTRRQSHQYDVNTVSLTDLLIRHSAPRRIDYLSIDTEGSEYRILSAFDFSRYEFSVITCEHNYTENRDRIRNLLSAHGYERIFEHISLFDDWYVKS